MVLQRSKPAAYIISPDQYERDRQELTLLRRQLFVAEIREAEAEFAAGGARSLKDVDALLDELRA